MKILMYIGRIVNIIYITVGSLFLLDIFSFLEIKGETIKEFIHFGSLLTTPLIIIFNVFILKSRKWNILISFSSVCILLSFSAVVSKRGVLGYLFSTESWNTQTVLYEHRHIGNKRIEFQMQDVGALGYNKRYVKVIYITKWFMITEETYPNKTFGTEWIKVDKDINELGIVY